MFDKEKRIEDNETLKRALHLAETGLYQSCRDIERELARQQYPRISEVLDPAMRKRIDKICFSPPDAVTAVLENKESAPGVQRALDSVDAGGDYLHQREHCWR